MFALEPSSAKHAQRKRLDRLTAARAKGTHTKSEWQLLHDVFGRCVSCGVPYHDVSGGEITKDHVDPIYLGGCDCIANIQPVCRLCNSSGVLRDARYDIMPGWQTLYLHRLGAYF
jgi:hypothetical protein